jgi:hypothetical protein
VIYAQERPTCLPLCSHISKTIGVTWVDTNKLLYTSNMHPHVFLSPQHNHLSKHDTKSTESIATVRSQFATITLSSPQLHSARYCLACCVLGDVVCQRGVHLGRCKFLQHYAPSSSRMGARMLLSSWLTIMAWPNLCSCLDTAPQELWKTALFLYQGSNTDKPNKEVMAETCTKLKSNHLAPLAIREHWRHHWVCDKETLRL